MTRLIKLVFSFINGFKGRLLETAINLINRPIKIRDKYGFNICLLPGDEISLYYNRGSITDSINIIEYLFTICNESFTCIDIGANMGSISLVMWRQVGLTGRVISIEADPNNIERIKTNLLLNNYPLNHIKNVAITDKSGELQLRRYIGINGWQTLGNPTFASNYNSEFINIPSISFCDLMEEYKLESVDIVKIDIEGAELLALQGMKQYLKNKKIGYIIFEVNHLMLEGFNKTVSDLMLFWNDYDYTLWILTPRGILEPLSSPLPDNFIGDCVAISR